MRDGHRRDAAADRSSHLRRRNANGRRGVARRTGPRSAFGRGRASRRVDKCGGAIVNAPANLARVLLIDSNVYFAKRLGDALKQQGFDVIPSTQAAYALTMIEWNAPAAILCATN